MGRIEFEEDLCTIDMLANELATLLPAIAQVGRDGETGHIVGQGGYIRITENWIAGLRVAAKRGEDVEFC